MELDSYQRRAVEAVEAGHNTLIIAGPGAGKTFVAEAISRLPLGRSAFLTHTRAAREVLRRRGVKASTIHSLCYHGLDYPIFDTFDSLLTYRGDGDFDWVVVDESQDLSYRQYEVVRTLGKHYVFVGDPYQSVFGFGGSYSEILNDFKGDFSPIECPILYNYRSNDRVVKELEAIFPRGIESRCLNKVRNNTAIIVRSRLEAEGISTLLRERGLYHTLLTGDYTKRDIANLCVMTAHCSKGMEFDKVIIRPWKMSSDEELRLHYVSVARARYRTAIIEEVSDIISEAINGK